MSVREINLLNRDDVLWVDLRFTGIKGKEQRLLQVSAVDKGFFAGAKRSSCSPSLDGRASTNPT